MANENDNLLLFNDDPVYAEYDDAIPAWNVLIADDDTAIHSVTKLVLSDVMFEGRPLNFISAYSGKQTKEVLAKDQEIAIVLLDVVMETPNSGLEIVKFLREQQHNHMTRIILRTGQPGEAPERSIITEYDINDYKEKADLTSQRLFSCVLSALRSYRDIVTIEQGKRGLERIIESSNLLFQANNSLSDFAHAVLDQLSALLQSDSSFIYFRNTNFAAFGSAEDFQIINGTPALSSFLHKPIAQLSTERIQAKVEEILKLKTSQITDFEYLGYFVSRNGFESVLYLGSRIKFSGHDRKILDLFSSNITRALENLSLNRDILDAQRRLLHLIGDAIETRQVVESGHLRRTSNFSLTLGTMLKLSAVEKEQLTAAVSLHDVGMIMVPQEIITKVSTLDQTETSLMRQHTLAGGQLLASNGKADNRHAAIVAAQHHEQWDGSGYPKGLQSEAIHLFARICTLADNVDALSHPRPWRPALSAEEIRQFLIQERAKRFDPSLVDLVLSDFDTFISIVKTDY